jgi:tetratricopeptide (TPR) repeat protein/tRNA A-37 threonylcarbamoyl transferase component Bud32
MIVRMLKDQMKNKIIIPIIIFLVFIFPGAAYSTNAGNSLDKKITALEKQLPTVSGKEKIDLLNLLATATYTAAPKKCVEYGKQILDLTKQIHYPRARAQALLSLSYALSVLGDWEKPFAYSKEALTIYANQNDKIGMGGALNVTGYLYTRIGYYNIALDYFLRSLKVYEEFGSKSDLYLPYFYIGNLYFNLEDYPKALEYYQKALDIVKDSRSIKQISYCLHNIGLCCDRLGNPTRALAYYRQALEMFEKSEDRFWISAALSNIGKVYGTLNQADRALDYLSQAERIQEKMGFKEELFDTLHQIGEIYVKMENYGGAQRYYDRGLDIAQKLDDKDSLEKVYKSCADLYAALGDYEKAFANYKMYSRVRETLFNKQKSKQIAELQVQFDAEKKGKEIEILKKDNKIRQITSYAFIIGFCLVSIILGLLFKRYLYLLAFWKKQKYIGQYRIIDTIGSGGMGTVYRAHTLRDKNELAAVKVLREELVENESSRQRFKHEGTIIDKLSHPNIVKVFERGEYKGKLYIAMEYLRGKTLAQKIKEENTMTLAECFHIMIQVSGALAFIHGKNVVHRDLNPNNIMLIDNNEDETVRTVKLLDFGVALMKFQTRLTQAGMLVGTIHYIAPEQITGNLYSSAGDVYSLGITFYEMLVGKSAFPQETITAVVEKILAEAPQEPVRLRADIPAELNRLIMRMLSKEPAQRPSTQDVLTVLKNMGK